MTDRAGSRDFVGPWVEALHNRIPDAMNPMVSELVRIWGFVGSQVLWMISPFVDSPALMRLADHLEDPKNAVGAESHREE